MKHKLISLLMLTTLMAACTPDSSDKSATDSVINTIKQQVGYQVQLIEQSGTILNPRTIVCGHIQYVPIDDWTSGFFPGTMWLMSDLTGDSTWLRYAEKYTLALDSVKYLQWHHDIGFMVNCSYGNALRSTGSQAYADVMVEAARSLSTRFRPAAGVLQSWDEDRGWQAERGWMCPVIIDNMMNLELLFKATRLSGDSSFHRIAVSHADQTMQNHFRPDGSCYHVVDYDKVQGGVRSRQTAQGYAHESAWARGQAWALYGFAICYRYTGDTRYLEQCRRTHDFIFGDENMPADLIPYWDYDAPNIPNEPRDASAAAVIASALYELSQYIPEYRAEADRIIESLCSPSYLALVGTNANFVLMHSVGSIPHDAEIDVPLNYADYYFIEALLRRQGKLLEKR